jgi:excinuclease ABC subunit A
MADIKRPCEDCGGARFKSDILEVTYNNKNISEVLQMTIDDAVEYFASNQLIVNKLTPLLDVGLGYIQMGQSASTLSGGEAQRVKLATFLGKGLNTGKILFIFDEPTTGLHFHDIKKLIKSFNALIDNGHSVIIIEHNLEIIKCADWVIDLGPEGGDLGGNVLFAGTPEELIKVEKSYTAKYLAHKLKQTTINQ